MKTPAARTRSRRARFAALAATLSIALLAGPAFADGGGSWNDGGPGNAGAKTGAAGGVPPGEFACGQNIGKQAGALYSKVNGAWTKWYDAGYPNCSGNASSDTGNLQICSAGFDVYRFYGTVRNPVQAMTRSKVNNKAWCQQESAYTFAGTTPYDANPAGNFGSPWAASVTTNQDAARNGLPSDVVARDTGLLTSGTPTKVSGSCVNAQAKGNPLAAWLATAPPAAKVALGTTIGSIYWTQSGHGRYPRNGLVEAGLSAIRGYLFSTAAWKSSGMTAAPTPNPNGDSYYASTYAFDNRPCATPFSFIGDSGGNPLDQPIYGTCYIPTLRKERQYATASGPAWGFPTLQHGDGERLSTFYAGGGYTPAPAGPGLTHDADDAAVANLTPQRSMAVKAAWRNAMVGDFRRLAANPFDANGTQLVAANPYLGETNKAAIGAKTPIDFAAAAQVLRNDARCRMGTHVEFSSQATAQPKAQQASSMITVQGPEYFQVGGSMRRQTLRVQTGALSCGGQPCGSGTYLKTLNYDVEVTGTNGYVRCATGQTSGCDFTVLSTTPSYAGQGIVDHVDAVVEFYNATQASPLQNVKVTVANRAGTYAYIYHHSAFTYYAGAGLDGKPIYVTTPAFDTEIVRPLPTPVVTGTPVPVQDGTGARPHADFVVIGAVAVPAG